MEGEQHHLLFPRRPWRAQEPTKELRHNHWLKPRLESDSHDALHRHVGMVAIPNYFMADRIKRMFEPVEGSYLRSIDNLLFVIDEMKNGYRSHSIEHYVGEIMLISIEAQLPYIREGLVDGK